MDATSRTPLRIGLIVVLLLVVVLAQNVAVAAGSSGSPAGSERVFGKAGFAYLSGIRVFAAAVLWDRLDPQFDLYYQNRDLAHDTQMMPTIWMVLELDPQFVQAYYNASWISARHGDFRTGFAIARRGIANNPHSGLMRASYIELLFLEGKDRHVQEAAAMADAGTAPGTAWKDITEKAESYAVFATAYQVAGEKQKGAAIRAEADRLLRQARSQSSSATAGE